MRTTILWACAGAFVGGVLGYKVADVSASLYFSKSGHYANGWRYSTELGRASPPSLKAAAFAKHEMMANIADEAVYYMTAEDVDGNALDGGRRYVIHFRQQDSRTSGPSGPAK